MRVALVSDIHGNAVALDAVLDDLDADPPDGVVCLGDVALDGPDPRGVVARPRGLGWPTVMGNCDAWLADPGRAPGGGERSEETAIERWCLAQLDDAGRSYLASFAPTVAVDLGGGRTLLCYHGAPGRTTTRLLPTTPGAELDGQLAGWPAEVYAGGHTHEPMVRRHGEALVVNPGSAGAPVGGRPGARRPLWAEYGIVTVEGGRSAWSCAACRWTARPWRRRHGRAGCPTRSGGSPGGTRRRAPANDSPARVNATRR